MIRLGEAVQVKRSKKWIDLGVVSEVRQEPKSRFRKMLGALWTFSQGRLVVRVTLHESARDAARRAVLGLRTRRCRVHLRGGSILEADFVMTCLDREPVWAPDGECLPYDTVSVIMAAVSEVTLRWL